MADAPRKNENQEEIQDLPSKKVSDKDATNVKGGGGDVVAGSGGGADGSGSGSGGTPTGGKGSLAL
ncbi:MAG: hypothetical protein M3068_13915 [Gemmatimonadota bacterium]|nr:hypothetical protein [Gemmatimonadota bacterium]